MRHTSDYPTLDHRYWLFGDGTRLPVIAGGSDAPPLPGTPAPPPPSPEGTGDIPKMFTQADLDRIVSDRLSREKSKYVDYDELKKKAASFDESEAANKTALEKATEALAKAETARTDAEKRATEALTRSAVLTAATGKVVDPDAAYRLLDHSTIIFDAAGVPSNLDALIDELAKSKPYLASDPAGQKKTGDRSADQGGRGTNAITREDIKRMSPEDVEKALTEGRLGAVLGQPA